MWIILVDIIFWLSQTWYVNWQFLWRKDFHLIMTLPPKTLRILIRIFEWLYFILCLVSFHFYLSPSPLLCTASEAVSWNIHKILSINSFSNVFIFGDLHDYRKASWIYSCRTDIPSELLYFSISNGDSQLVNFLT